MRNWRLRTKLLVVLLVPALAALALGALQVVADYQKAQQLERIKQQVELDASAAQVVHQLQQERDLTVAYIASGRTTNQRELRDQRAAVDEAVQNFRADIDSVADSGHTQVVDAYQEAAARLDRLNSLRTVTDTTSYPAEAALRAYTTSVSNLLNLGEQGVTRIDNPAVVRLYLASNALSRVKEQESIKRARLVTALEEGEFRIGDSRALLAADAELQAALKDFRKWGSNSQVQSYNDTVAGLVVDRAHTMEETALVRGQTERDLSGMDPAEWLNVSTQLVNLNYEIGTKLREQLQSDVDDLAATARTETYLAGALVIGALVLAIAIALMVARSLLLPLRTLRRSALDVADNRLPDAVETILDENNPDLATSRRIDPIPVHTTEEIGRVARSFDAVHAQALRLASEQALLRNNVNDLFVNLARRGQTLVQRQLSLIDRLEQDEQDPDQLAQLFELDHLATRMRRNNENLLILGGTDLARRTVRPVPLTEVVGAAVSEVEQYARIAIAESPELGVQGRVVNDIVHLIAELLENATVYSNPDTEVTVRTAYRRQELVLEIRDRGVGLDEGELDEINERLVRPPEIDVSVSRRMGLYVVGQLGRRHNIKVELQNNGDLGGGATATVRLPGELIVQLTPNGPMPMPDVPASADAARRDSTGDTGSHTGLAAAFSGAGAAERSRSDQLEHFGGGDFGGGDFGATEFMTNGSVPRRNGTPQPDQRAGTETPAIADGAPQAWPDEDYDRGREPDYDDGDDARESAGVDFDDEAYGDAFGTSYSVRVSPGDAYGVTDVPHWDDDRDSPESGHEAVNGYGVGLARDGAAPVDPYRSSEFERDRYAADRHDDSDDAEEPVDFEGQCGPPPGVDSPDLFHSPFEEEKTAYIPQFDDSGSASGLAGLGRSGAGGTRTDSGIPGGDLAGAEGGNDRSAGPEMDDTPTERLPIYEAVLSQWFRESETDESASSGMSGLQADDGLGSEGAFAEQSGGFAADGLDAVDWNTRGRDRHEPFGGHTDESSVLTESGSDQHDTSQSLEAPAAPEPSAQTHTSEATRTGMGTAAQALSGRRRAASREQRNRAADARQAQQNESGWGAGDEGWQAAEALAQEDQGQEETSAGLPKRRPKSNLVPGSAAQPQSPPPSKPAVPRSADAVRGRMSNFQQGVRRGRHAKVESDTTEQSRSSASRPEEQE